MRIEFINNVNNEDSLTQRHKLKTGNPQRESIKKKKVFYDKLFNEKHVFK
jgi:hypothetical protein